MSNYHVVEKTQISAVIETLVSNDGERSFVRVKITTPYGDLYYRPDFKSRDYALLEITSQSL